MSWRIVLSQHARDRGIERARLYPGQVRRAVEEALANGQLSASPPAGVRNGRRNVLYAWSSASTGAPVFVLEARADAFVVVTVLEREAG